MDSDIDVPYLVLLVILAALFLKRMFDTSRSRHFRLVFSAYEVVSIGECKDNRPHGIKGKVILIGKPLTAPLSERQCAMYSISAKRTQAGDRTFEWLPIGKELSKSNLLIKDGDHYAYVVTNKASILVNNDRKFTTGAFNPPCDNLAKFLDIIQYDNSGFFGGRTIKCREGIIGENETIAVCGKGQWVDIKQYKSLAFLAEQNVDQVYVIKHDAEYPVHLTDKSSIVKALV